jgi:hydrogenase maturation protease
MTIPSGTLVVGLGSPYGDDQVGWRLADAVRQRNAQEVAVRHARSALELLDWLGGVERLVICDACQGAGPVGSWRHWRWPSADLQPLQSLGSHDLGLASVLALAETLGRLPREVKIWAVEGISTVGAGPNANLSAEVELAVPRVAALITEELSDARAIVG